MNNTKSQETVKHTPTPWHIQRNAHRMYIAHNKPRPDYTWREPEMRHDHYAITRDWHEQRSGAKRGCSPSWYGYPAIVEANAQFIVKAVNCHDDLLEACKQAYYSVCIVEGTKSEYRVLAPEKLIEMLDAALQKAGAK